MDYALFVDESDWDSVQLSESFQIAGFWGPAPSSPRDILIQFDKRAQALKTKCCEASELPLYAAHHATDAKTHHQFSAFAAHLFQEIPKEWNLVRIVNSNNIDFGDPETNYMMHLAQLIAHVEDQIKCIDSAAILHLVAARVMKHNESSKEYDLELNKESYINRIAIERMIHRLRFDSPHMKPLIDAETGKTRIESARNKKRHALHVCDWTSFCSLEGYSKLTEENSDEAAKAMNLLSNRITTLKFDPAGYHYHLDQMIQNQRLGEAALLLAQFDDESDRLDIVLDGLGELTAIHRDTQLATLSAHWELLINRQRNPDAWKVLERHHDKVLQPLRELFLGKKSGQETTLEPIFFAYHWACLEACNHQGHLVAATTHRKELLERSPSLAARWDQVALLLEGYIRIAVHDVDRFESQEAIRSMKAMEQFVSGVGSLFHSALPEVFPEQVHSDVLARLLGTHLQAEIHNIAQDTTSVDRARKLNDDARTEFADPKEVSRQQQYRCHIEALAGDAPAARDWLGRSFDLDAESSHQDLADCLDGMASLEDAFHRVGWGLLHWSRIASRDAISGGNKQEAIEFSAALNSTPCLRKHRWITGEQLQHPAHAIRRHLATIEASNGNDKVAIALLKSMRYLATFDGKDHGQPLLDLFLTTAQCECAVLFARAGNAQQARPLLVSDNQTFRGALPRLQNLAKKIHHVAGLESLCEYVTEFQDRAVAAVEQLEVPSAAELEALGHHSQRFSH